MNRNFSETGIRRSLLYCSLVKFGLVVIKEPRICCVGERAKGELIREDWILEEEEVHVLVTGVEAPRTVRQLIAQVRAGRGHRSWY